jgi:hypothetical protein
MAGVSNFYGGTNYGLDSNYGKVVGNYRSNVSGISLATDPRSANQLKMTSEKVNTGAKAIEVQMTLPEVAKAIPRQNLQEIARLQKLTGIDLTLHGPLIEPSGITNQGFDETQRAHAERDIWEAVKRGKEITDKKNLVITLHSSNGLPEPQVKDKKLGETTMWVVDEMNGKVGAIQEPPRDHFEGKTNLTNTERLKDLNKRIWQQEVGNMEIEANRARNVLNEVLDTEQLKEEKKIGPSTKEVLDFYAKAKKNPADYMKEIKEFSKEGGNAELAGRIMNEKINALNFADTMLTQSYEVFKRQFTTAYENADDKTKKMLDEYRSEAAPKIKEFKDNPTKIKEFSDTLSQGMMVLNSINADSAPQQYKPLREFAIKKSAETFSNVALNAYKEFGGDAPVLSIENPPAGSGLSRGEDLRDIVKTTREMFVEKVVKEEGMSRDKAEAEAKKLIGVTWDVGHINLLKKYGYDDKDIAEQTKMIAKDVKNIHLSDNFGTDHSELPMGMGNVPLTQHLGIITDAQKDKINQIKKIVEIGDWAQHFQTSGLPETMEAFGSPIYAMNMAPYWSGAVLNQGGYWAGKGMNPDYHHSVYGAGFSNMPVSFGGQMEGKSRFSGSPIE